jgi:transglutaminase-like putative cysteine protease
MKAPANLIDRLLPINVAIVSILGITMLGMGQRDLKLVVAGIVAVVVSLIVTDLNGWVFLNRMLANVAAVVAVAFSLRDFMKFDPATQLLAIANLLIYLQIVLLFQKKLLRVYWQILVLSLLQVVVGTALNMGVGFGAMMAVFLFFMLTAMMLLHIRRQALRYGTMPRGQSALSELTDIDEFSSRETRTSPIHVSPSTSATLVQKLAQTGILRHSLSGSFYTVILAALLFYALPRTDENVWAPVATADPSVGFTSTVSLHSLGSILANEELVMRVAFRNENDREKPFQVNGEPLFRGTVLNHYVRGEWGHKSRGPLTRTRTLNLPAKDPRLEAALQQITIEPLAEPVVFGVYPLHRLNERQRLPGLRWDAKRVQLTRTEDVQDQRLAYETLTTGFRKGAQRAVIPEGNLRTGDRAQHLQLPYTEWESAQNFGVEAMLTRRENIDPLDDLPELAATAARQIAAAGIVRGDPEFKVKAARALERYLKYSSRFTYTLAHVPRDPNIDPIEDFIKNNPSGHCEYFASALALMLRTQGIPTRMAVGFKGGEYNQVGAFYQVRQMHAHAWVEAYLDPAEIPEGERPREGEAQHGWLVLDPTPREDDADALAETGFLAALSDFGEYLQHWWTTYVIGLNADRQRELYQPLSDIADAAEGLSEESGPRRWVGAVAAWLRSDALTLRGAAIVGYLALLILVFGRLAARLGSQFRWPVFARRAKRRAKATERVDFYERLERLLARHGFRRQQTQTPLEFALATGAELVAEAELRPAATLPRRIVETYYRVRFGRRALDNRERSFVEQQLDELDAALVRLQRRG